MNAMADIQAPQARESFLEMEFRHARERTTCISLTGNISFRVGIGAACDLPHAHVWRPVLLLELPEMFLLRVIFSSGNAST